MLNLKNDYSCLDESQPMKTYTLAEHASFACRRPVGEGYFDKNSNKTILCWNGPGMDVYLREYDHETRSFSEEVCICKNHMFGKWDYHNYINMVDRGDGTPVLFQAIHSQRLYMITKEDSGEWKKILVNEDQVCYPAPISVDGIVYVFYSKNDEISYPYRTYRYIKSMDGGKNWSDPVTILDSERSMKNRFDEIYMCGSELTSVGGKHFVQLTWTMWGGPNGHASQGKGAYFVQFCLEDEMLYAADGERLGKRVGYRQMVEKCLIEEAEPNEEFSHTCAGPVSVRCKDGIPYVVYGIRGKEEYRQGKIRMAYMSEGIWKTQDLVNDCFNVEDMCVHQEFMEFVAAQGDKVTVYRADPQSGECTLRSATTVPRRNGANTFYYINYIDNHQKELQLMVGMGQNNTAESSYKGMWDIILLGE